MLKTWIPDWPARIGVTIAALTGFLLWVLSPSWLGVSEPWDAEEPAYLLVMAGAGMLAGLVAARWEFAVPGYVAVWMGQVLALLVVPDFQLGWLVLGTVTTAIGSLAFFLGSGAGVGIRVVLRGEHAG